MNNDDFYKTPPLSTFLNIQAACVRVFEDYDDTHGYASGKIGLIMELNNVQDNALVPYNMLDFNNQAKARAFLSLEALQYIQERMWH